MIWGLAQPDDLRELLAHVAIGKCLLNADAKMRAPPGEFVAACVNSSDLAKIEPHAGRTGSASVD